MKPGKNGPDGREKYQDAYIKQNSYNCTNVLIGMNIPEFCQIVPFKSVYAKKI